MFWTFSIVLGLFIHLHFRDWLCPSREVAGGFSVGPGKESWSLSLGWLLYLPHKPYFQYVRNV